MKKNHRLRVGIILLILTLCGSMVFAQVQGKSAQPMPPPPVQSLANIGYLYVLIGPSVHQYKLSDLTLQKTVTLPASEDSSQANAADQKPPRPPAASMIIEDENLYLVNFGHIYQYSLPDLTLEQIHALPTPESLK